MYSTFLGACLAGVALSLQINSGLHLPENTTPAINFTQAGASRAISTQVCQRTATRNKAAVPDFYTLYAGSSKFEDSAFPHGGADIFAWADASETSNLGTNIVWKRASEAFPSHTLFGTNGVTPEDMR